MAFLIGSFFFSRRKNALFFTFASEFELLTEPRERSCAGKKSSPGGSHRGLLVQVNRLACRARTSQPRLGGRATTPHQRDRRKLQGDAVSLRHQPHIPRRV